MPSPRPLFALLCCTLGLACLLATPLAAQQAVFDGNQNLPPYGGFSGGQFDTISLQNGNLHLHIPVGTWEQRGGSSVWLAFEYDTPTWTRVTSMQTINQHRYYFTNLAFNPLQWGAKSNVGFWQVSSDRGSIYCPGLNANVNLYDTWVVTDPEGTKHPVDLVTSGDNCQGNQTNGPTTDGSGMMVNIGSNPPMLTLKDGTEVVLSGSGSFFYGNSTIEDTNGNLQGPTDTTGRTLLTVTQGPPTTLTSPDGAQVKNTPSYTIYAVLDSNGNTRDYRVDYVAIDVATNFCGYLHNPPYYACSEYDGPIAVPAKLTLPSQGFYEFSWINSTPAELGSVVLPTGGSIGYTYSTGCTHGPLVDGESGTTVPYDCQARVLSRTVSAGGTKQHLDLQRRNRYGSAGKRPGPHFHSDQHQWRSERRHRRDGSRLLSGLLEAPEEGRHQLYR